MRSTARRVLTAIVALAMALATAPPARAGWEEGVAAFKGGDFAQAAKEFQGVVQERPEWPGGHYMLGQSLQRLRRHDEALTHLRKAYDLDPNQVSFQLALGQAYLSNQRFNDSAQLLATINPSSLPAAQQQAYYEILAVSYEKIGQTDQALVARERLVRAAPSDAEAQYRYGLTAFNAGQTATAVSALEKAVQLDPNDLAKKEAFVKVLIRRARESTGNQKVQLYRKAIAAASDLAAKQPTYNNLLTLGEVHLGAKDYRGAAAAFERAAAKNGGDWLVHYYSGQAYTSLEQYARAEEALRNALDRATREQDKRTIWSQIGFVNEKLRNYDDAKLAYRNAGNAAGVARVEKNEQIAAENAEIEAENERIRALEEERRRLEEELKSLPGSGPPPLR